MGMWEFGWTNILDQTRTARNYVPRIAGGGREGLQWVRGFISCSSQSFNIQPIAPIRHAYVWPLMLCARR
jgi:hypothetical protein